MKAFNRKRRLFAIFAVVLMLATPLVCITADDSSEHESDANVQEIMERFWFTGLLGGFVFGSWIAGTLDSGLSDESNRLAESKILYSNLNAGVNHYAHALQVYSNVWQFTSEHWIRQSELAATSQWYEGATYDQDAVLSASGTYPNSAMMMVNGTVQINSHLNESLKDHVASWQSADYKTVYGDGNMTLSFTTSGETMTLDGRDDWTARLGLMAVNVESGKDRVWFAGGLVFADRDTTITNEATGDKYPLKGNTWTLIGDETDPSDDASYILGTGATFVGNFFPVFSYGTPLVSGFAITKNGLESMFVYYTEESGVSKVVGWDSTTGKKYGSSVFTIDISTKDGEVYSQSLMPIMEYYEQLLESLWDVVVKADQAARTVWTIFGFAGEASSTLTTLTVPENYYNVQLNDVQKELVTVMAMKQLSDYWQDHSGSIKRDSYAMTDEALSLYCRGDVYLKNATADGMGSGKILENVFFTPLFYTDHTLEKGQKTTVRNYGYVLVWGSAEGKTLQSFDAASFDDAEIVFLTDGSEIMVSEMRYTDDNGRTTYPTSMDLESRSVEYIDRMFIDIPESQEPERQNDMAELVRLVCILFGSLMMLAAFRSGNIKLAIVAFLILLVGILFAEAVEDVLERFRIVFTWPEI